MSIRFWGFEALYAGLYWINLREAGPFAARVTGAGAVAALLIPLAGTLLSGLPVKDENFLTLAVAGAASLVLLDARRRSIVEHFHSLDGECSTGYRLSLVVFMLIGLLSCAFAWKGGPSVVVAVTAVFAFFPLFPLQRACGWGKKRKADA